MEEFMEIVQSTVAAEVEVFFQKQLFHWIPSAYMFLIPKQSPFYGITA